MNARTSSTFTILCINAGSSSVKTTLYRMAPETSPRRIATLSVSGIGEDTTTLDCRLPGEENEERRECNVADHREAVDALLDTLREHDLPVPDAIGHRIVRSPPGCSDPALLDAGLRERLEAVRELAPLHIPPELAAIDAARDYFPDAVQSVCFDNHFFSRLPDMARRLPLPRELDKAGIRRIGYHGLSYEYIVRQLPPDSGRTVIAHLGNGASLAAVVDGQAIDTTMGYTPTGGLMMGTRSGDLDPGALVAAMRMKKLDADGLEHLVDQQSGLAGVSGNESGMKELLEQADGDNAAEQAVALFCYIARKHLGAMIAALGGIDTLVFTGGVGENAAPVRARILDGLDDLGLRINLHANTRGAADIGNPDSRTRIRVIATDEDWIIANHTARLLQRKATSG